MLSNQESTAAHKSMLCNALHSNPEFLQIEHLGKLRQAQGTSEITYHNYLTLLCTTAFQLYHNYPTLLCTTACQLSLKYPQCSTNHTEVNSTNSTPNNSKSSSHGGCGHSQHNKCSGQG